jgi:hypothetical protein
VKLGVNLKRNANPVNDSWPGFEVEAVPVFYKKLNILPAYLSKEIEDLKS